VDYGDVRLPERPASTSRSMIDIRASTGPVLQVYLLGTVDFEEMLRVQRRLVYDVAGDRDRAVLILCEHPPGISVGREGSREHIRCGPAELAARRWPVRWVNRGGGCLLHLPGQLAIYPIVALDRLGLGLQAYLDHLHPGAAGDRPAAVRRGVPHRIRLRPRQPFPIPARTDATGAHRCSHSSFCLSAR